MTIFDKNPGDRNRDGEFVPRKNFEFYKPIIYGFGALLLLILFLTFFVRVTRIEAGHVGVEINLAGSQRGASEIPARTGWVVYSPLRTQSIEFPTSGKTVKWRRSLDEGHPINEEMGF